MAVGRWGRTCSLILCFCEQEERKQTNKPKTSNNISVLGWSHREENVRCLHIKLSRTYAWTHVRTAHKDGYINMPTHIQFTIDHMHTHTQAHAPYLSTAWSADAQAENCKYWATPCPWKIKYNSRRQFIPLLLFLWTNMFIVVAFKSLNKYPILPERRPWPCCLRECFSQAPALPIRLNTEGSFLKWQLPFWHQFWAT